MKRVCLLFRRFSAKPFIARKSKKYYCYIHRIMISLLSCSSCCLLCRATSSNLPTKAYHIRSIVAMQTVIFSKTTSQTTQTIAIPTISSIRMVLSQCILKRTTPSITFRLSMRPNKNHLRRSLSAIII